MLGGCLEYLSLAFGYRALLIIAAILYVGAYLVMPRERRVPRGSSPGTGSARAAGV